MTEKDAMLEVNAAFYSAFAAGDIGELARLWAQDDGISCIHPGWPALVGRAAVIGSWRDILRSPNRPEVQCQKPYAIVAGDSGRVLCIEIVGGLALAASNHFTRIDGAWRLVHHQSSPIAPFSEEPAREPSASNRQVH